MAYRTRRITDIAVILLTLVIGAAVLIPMGHKNRIESRKAKDQAQVRGLIVATMTWATSGMGNYPLPGQIDNPSDTFQGTTRETGESKNSTSNILSLLIFNGGLSPEMVVSPAEVSDQVRMMRNYAYQAPATAPDPNSALWDPAFRATPVEPLRLEHGDVDPARTAPANQSYAHLPPFGKRRNQWADTYNSGEAVFCNRGPTYAAGDRADPPFSNVWTLPDDATGSRSRTLSIHGDSRAWSGFVGYNDNHVVFATSPTPPDNRYSRLGPPRDVEAPDNLFVDETNEAHFVSRGRAATADERLNAYLRPIYNVTPGGQYSVWRD
jgi:hypothetical protein